MCVKPRKLFLLLACLASLGCPVVAEDTVPPGQPAEAAGVFFAKGNWEGMAGGAVMFSPVGAVGGRPQLNYSVAVGQAGYMVTEVRSSGLLRGNFEAVGEVFGGGIYEGRGTYVSGLTLYPTNLVPDALAVAYQIQGQVAPPGKPAAARVRTSIVGCSHPGQSNPKMKVTARV